MKTSVIDTIPILWFFGIIFACFMMLGKPNKISASNLDIRNAKSYGNCHVFDSVNLLTDEVDYVLGCWEGEYYDLITPYVMFIFDQEGTTPDESILLHTKPQYVRSDDSVDILVRVDTGKVREGRVFATERGTAITSAMLTKTDDGFCFRIPDLTFFTSIDSLLDEMAMGKRVVFQVGDNGASISLRGSAAAISDYESRIARYINCRFY